MVLVVGCRTVAKVLSMGFEVRIDMDACPRDVFRRKFPPDLHDMPPGFRPGQRQTAC